MEKEYDFKKFADAHHFSFDTALAEIRNGKKESHWMWYIFPQILGLGFSSTAQYYAITNLEEARAFLNDKYLGGNLLKICEALLELKINDPHKIFGYPDDLKLKSSMTLFTLAAPEIDIFEKVLAKYYNGEKCNLTEEIIENIKE